MRTPIPSMTRRWRSPFTGLGTDFRLAFHFVRHRPGHSLGVVLTLALGIGISTALFTVADRVLLRPLAFGRPGGLVAVWESAPERGQPRNEVSVPNFLDWRDATRSFASLGAYAWGSANLTGEGGPERVQGILVTPGLLGSLEVAPLLGRTFPLEDSAAGQPDAASVVLSHGLWQRRFGGRTDLLGATVMINDAPHEVVGVMPAGFEFPPETAVELWVPLYTAPLAGASRSFRYLYVVGRLADGIPAAEAESELAVVAERLAAAHPAANQGWTVRVVPLHSEVVGGVARPVLVLLAASLLVLLTAIVNVASLLLTRFQALREELGIRAALGASAGRMVRQLLVGTGVLGLLGALPGAALAAAGVRLLLRLEPGFIPRLSGLSIDARALGFCVVASLTAALASGLLPAWRVIRRRRHPLAPSSPRTLGAGSHHALRGALVVAQTALVLALLVGSDLVLRSLLRLRAADPGFRPERVLTFEIHHQGPRYAEPALLRRAQAAVLDTLAEMPGVESIGASSHLPLAGGNMSTSFELADGRTEPGVETEINYRVVSPGYFRTLAIPLREGRSFDPRDDAGAPRVALVNERAARRYFAGRSPVGERIVISDEPVEIVGVVGDVRHWALHRSPEPELYLPYAQQTYSHARVVLRAAATPSVASLRAALARIDPAQPIYNVRPMEQIYGAALARADLLATLLSAFAAVSLALAAVGIFGVVAASSQQRRREIGLRLALGADRGGILRLLLRRTAVLVAAGLACGAVLAFWMARALAGLLYEVRPDSPAAFAAMAGLLTLVALVASWLPARRASRIDPVLALGRE